MRHRRFLGTVRTEVFSELIQKQYQYLLGKIQHCEASQFIASTIKIAQEMLCRTFHLTQRKFETKIKKKAESRTKQLSSAEVGQMGSLEEQGSFIFLIYIGPSVWSITAITLGEVRQFEWDTLDMKNGFRNTLFTLCGGLLYELYFRQ